MKNMTVSDLRKILENVEGDLQIEICVNIYESVYHISLEKRAAVEKTLELLSPSDKNCWDSNDEVLSSKFVLYGTI